MNKLRFYLTNRFILFVLIVGVFLLLNLFYTKSLLPTTDVKNVWFYSGLFMILFSVLFIEPYYSSPKNVITNSIPLLLVYLSIQQSFKNEKFWWISIAIILFLIVISIVAISLKNENKSDESARNRVSKQLKSIAVLVGQGKVLYSGVFISIMFLYKAELLSSFSDTYFFILLLLWGVLLLIDTKSIHNNFSLQKEDKNKDSLGEIFSVQSNNMFLVKLFEDKTNVNKFDIVRFKYQMDKTSNWVNSGFIFDTYDLNSQKWAKVLKLQSSHMDDISGLRRNTVYKISDLAAKKELAGLLNIDNFVGVVIEGSKIGVIKFEYSKKVNNLQEGDLLELSIDGIKIFYQVLGGTTESEKLENKDESGFIEGEAVQLGLWKNSDLSFEKYGWIPEINTPLFVAQTENIPIPTFELPDFQLGIIPNTILPSVINLDDAVSHHLALLGVTGAGKSFLAREIIKKLILGTNVICIDFTGEYKKDLKDLKPCELIKKEGLSELEKIFADKHQKALQKKPAEELQLRKDIQKKLDDYVKKFMSDENNLGLFELPALSNTSFILEFTQFFVESVFNYAKDNEDVKTCLVLEEAHTIVPETGFLGDLGDYGSTKALVNKMSQIALQGRKYNVGLMVIAQRTANVSKTVLTQCNTIICFQAFDETSYNFLGNYVGKDLVHSLPTLKKYHAIVTGKAIKSNIPMIVNLERK